MPVYKAIFIPKWMQVRKKQQISKTTLYHRMLSFMHWRSANSIEQDLLEFVPAQIVRDQLTDRFYEIRQELKGLGNPNLMVASVSMSQHLEQEIVVTISPDIKFPKRMGCIALRLGGDGTIVDVIRDYFVNPLATATSK